MGHIPLLEELAIIAALGVAVTVLLSMLRFPTVAGLLAAGALLGPFGLGLVREVEAIESLAEVGVVLLLFTIGLEFSLSRLKHIFRQAALGGVLQVVGTAAMTFLIAIWFGEEPRKAVFYGFVLALSSTAIVLRALADRGELDAPHGRFIVGALIFQDLCVVPMVLLVPVLAKPRPVDEVALDIGLALGKAGLVVAGALLVAKLLIPRLLRMVAASRSREVFLLAVLAICVGTAWLTSLVGLSLALGAFLGGMVVADTEFQHRALGDMIPLRDAFVSIFFVSLGMLFDSSLLVQRPLDVALLLMGFILGKAILAMLSAQAMRFPARAAWLAGIGLAQFGEFGFVLIRQGAAEDLIRPETAKLVLAAGIISMFLTPLLIRLAPHITAGEKLLAPLTKLLGVRSIDQIERTRDLQDHVIIIGYGIAGKLTAHALDACGQPYIALELNAETVRRAKAAGEPVYYADATSTEALGYAQIGAARAVAVLINDPQAVLRVVDTIHRVAPRVPLIVRTRYFAERGMLMEMGATDVVAEEAEGSMEIIARLLRRLELPRNLIDAQIREARQEMGTGTRQITIPRRMLPEHKALADLKIDSVLLVPGSPAVGRTSRDLNVRQRTQALIVAVRRGKRLMESPDPEKPFREGDIIYLVGSEGAIRGAMELLVAIPTA